MAILARRSGAEVAALDLLAPWVEHWSEAMDADDAFAERVMTEHGIPEDVRHGAARRLAQLPRLGRGGEVTRPLAAGSELVLRDRTLRVLHRPGHSPTDTIFHDEAARASCSAPITSSSTSPPTRSSRGRVEATRGGRRGGGEAADRPHALEIYMDSLRATRAMDDVDLVLAGHGEPVTDHVELIDERFRMHARRAEKIRRLIAEGAAHGLRDRAGRCGATSR